MLQQPSHQPTGFVAYDPSSVWQCFVGVGNLNASRSFTQLPDWWADTEKRRDEWIALPVQRSSSHLTTEISDSKFQLFVCLVAKQSLSMQVEVFTILAAKRDKSYVWIATFVSMLFAFAATQLPAKLLDFDWSSSAEDLSRAIEKTRHIMHLSTEVIHLFSTSSTYLACVTKRIVWTVNICGLIPVRQSTLHLNVCLTPCEFRLDP